MNGVEIDQPRRYRAQLNFSTSSSDDDKAPTSFSGISEVNTMTVTLIRYHIDISHISSYLPVKMTGLTSLSLFLCPFLPYGAFGLSQLPLLHLCATSCVSPSKKPELL